MVTTWVHIRKHKTLCSPTHIIAFDLKGFEKQRDAVLRGRDELPHAVLIGGVFLRPSWTCEGAVEVGHESTAGSCWGQIEEPL